MMETLSITSNAPLKYAVIIVAAIILSGCPQKRQRPPVNFDAPTEQTNSNEKAVQTSSEENKKGEIDLGIEGESDGPIEIDNGPSEPTTAPTTTDVDVPATKTETTKTDRKKTDATEIEPPTGPEIVTNKPTGDLDLNIEQKRDGERPPKPTCNIKKANKDGVCPMNFKPVCGCDEKTYSNACDAGINGVPVWYEGKCD